MKFKVETAIYFVYEVEADNLEDAEILANNADTDITRSSDDSNGNIVDVLLYEEAPTGVDLTKLNALLNNR